MKPSTRLAFLFVLQALALAFIIADRQWTLASGARVVLETEPVDPRSLFSGDYVRLRYKISRLAIPESSTARGLGKHDDIYVVLAPGDPYWQPVSMHAAMPVAAPGRIVLRGEVEHAGGAPDKLRRVPVEEWHVSVRYGIESYFVPESEGRTIERPAPDEKVSIRVAVDTRGRAAIQALLVNGREKYIERLF